MENGITREALQVVENHDILVVHFAEELEHVRHAGTFHEITAAGDLILENLVHEITFGRRVLAAAVFLAVQPTAFRRLSLAGHAAVNQRFFGGQSFHV